MAIQFTIQVQTESPLLEGSFTVSNHNDYYINGAFNYAFTKLCMWWCSPDPKYRLSQMGITGKEVQDMVLCHIKNMRAE